MDCGRQAVVPTVKQYVETIRLCRESREREFFFIRSIQLGMELARELKYSFYYSESVNKMQVLQA